MLEAGRGGLGTREAIGQKRELSQSDRKESFQRPLMVRGGKGREQGRDPKSTGGDEEAAPYLAQVCSMFQALSSLSGRRSPGGGHSPGRYQALPRSLQRKKPESLPPPQLLLAPAEDRDLFSAFWRERENRSAPAAPSANGAPGTRQGLFSGGGWTLLLRPSPGRGRTRSQAETRLAGTS